MFDLGRGVAFLSIVDTSIVHWSKMDARCSMFCAIECFHIFSEDLKLYNDDLKF